MHCFTELCCQCLFLFLCVCSSGPIGIATHTLTIVLAGSVGHLHWQSIVCTCVLPYDPAFCISHGRICLWSGRVWFTGFDRQIKGSCSPRELLGRRWVSSIALLCWFSRRKKLRKRIRKSIWIYILVLSASFMIYPVAKSLSCSYPMLVNRLLAVDLLFVVNWLEKILYYHGYSASFWLRKKRIISRALLTDSQVACRYWFTQRSVRSKFLSSYQNISFTTCVVYIGTRLWSISGE